MPKLRPFQRLREKESLTKIIQSGQADAFKVRVGKLLELYGLPTVFYFLEELFLSLTQQQKWWASGLLWGVDVNPDIPNQLCWEVLLDFFDNHGLRPASDYYFDANQVLYLHPEGAKVFKKFCFTVVLVSSAKNSIRFALKH